MTAYVRPVYASGLWSAVVHDGTTELWRSESSADRVDVMSDAFSHAMAFMPERLVLEDYRPEVDEAAA